MEKTDKTPCPYFMIRVIAWAIFTFTSDANRKVSLKTSPVLLKRFGFENINVSCIGADDVQIVPETHEVYCIFGKDLPKEAQILGFHLVEDADDRARLFSGAVEDWIETAQEAIALNAQT